MLVKVVLLLTAVKTRKGNNNGTINRRRHPSCWKDSGVGFRELVKGLGLRLGLGSLGLRLRVFKALKCRKLPLNLENSHHLSALRSLSLDREARR